MGYLAPILDSLDEATVARLLHDELNDDFDWTPVVERARAILNIARRLDLTSPLEMPENIKAQSESSLRQVVHIVQQLADLDYVRVQNAHNSRDSLIQQLTQQWQEWRNYNMHARPALPDERAILNLTELAKRLSNEVEVVDGLQDRAGIVLAQVTDALSRLEHAASAEAAGRLSKFYKDQVATHEKRARLWLLSAIASAVVLAVASVGIFQGVSVEGDLTGVRFARDAISRLLILGLVGYAVSFCARGYRAQTHLGIVCQQKANALDTFGLFQESVDSDAAREAMILELVRTVFATSDSGYLDSSADKTIVQEQSSALVNSSPPAASSRLGMTLWRAGA